MSEKTTEEPSSFRVRSVRLGWVMIVALFLSFLLPQSVYPQGANVTLVSPPDDFSVSNGSLITLIARVENESDVGEVNGTLCVTYSIGEGKGLCCSPSSGGVIECEILNVPVLYGTRYWNANFTDETTSNVYYSDETRKYIGIFTNRILLPIYPINNETVTGDNTNFIVNYTVDLYLPYDLTYNLYIHFYAYSSYVGFPLTDSERKICSIEVKANETSTIPAGIHRYGCENYMYESYNVNYEELPNYKFWRAKLKIINDEIEGANLLSDTGFQNYNYAINTNLAHVYPPNGSIYCHKSGFFYFNGTLYNINPFCNFKSWEDQFIPFYSYLRDDGCNGGNLTWRYRNAVNPSQTDECVLYLVSNNTEDYFECDIMPDIDILTNTTYYGTRYNYTAIHLIHNWTYNCENGTTFQTSDKDFWYITGISITNVTSIYPEYPLTAINDTALLPSLAVHWGDFFNTDLYGGLFLMSLFFILVMSIVVTLNSDVIGGAGVGVFGTMVFVRIGYMHIAIMFIMLILAGLTFVYMIRRILLHR